MHALLGRVMQLPGDALTLALNSQALGAQSFLAQAPEHVGGVGQREHDDERDHDVRGDRLQAHRALQRLRVKSRVDRDPEKRQREEQAPDQRTTKRQTCRGKDERGEHEDVKRAAPVLRGRNEAKCANAVDEPRHRQQLQLWNPVKRSDRHGRIGDRSGDQRAVVRRHAVHDQQQHRDRRGEQPRHDQQCHPA